MCQCPGPEPPRSSARSSGTTSGTSGYDRGTSDVRQPGPSVGETACRGQRGERTLGDPPPLAPSLIGCRRAPTASGAPQPAHERPGLARATPLDRWAGLEPPQVSRVERGRHPQPFVGVSPGACDLPARQAVRRRVHGLPGRLDVAHRRECRTGVLHQPVRGRGSTLRKPTASRRSRPRTRQTHPSPTPSLGCLSGRPAQKAAGRTTFRTPKCPPLVSQDDGGPTTPPR